MYSKIEKFITKKLPLMNFDSVAVASIDFEKLTYKTFELSLDPSIDKNIYFDLASLTKPLTLGALYLLSPDLFTKEMILLLEHRGGIPAWGRLSKDGWKDQVSSYLISEEITKYSDLSALRLQLELEKKSSQKLENLSSFYWNKELCFWKNIPDGSSVSSTGHRGAGQIRGSVHDDNSFIINQFTSHAGLFSTITGLSESLLNLDKKTELLQKMDLNLKKTKERFVKGWDRVEDINHSLAGLGADSSTFGHLGFTGTSLWISTAQKKGYILLTNETKSFWYDRKELNNFRRKVGEMIWETTR